MPNADARLSGPVTDSLAGLEITADTSVIVVSRDVEIDVTAVAQVIDSAAGYIGVMGSARRWRVVRERLAEQGVSADALERIHVPIGLDLGAETVEEIAVSIMGEVIGIRRGTGVPDEG